MVLVTQRMLKMFKKVGGHMGTSLITVAYLVASILFILSLRGLSSQETAQRGNWYGILGMGIAIPRP